MLHVVFHPLYNFSKRQTKRYAYSAYDIRFSILFRQKNINILFNIYNVVFAFKMQFSLFHVNTF